MCTCIQVSGVVHSGEVLAIMGLSGSGKTTLLDIIAHKPKIGRIIQGDVSYFRDGQLLPAPPSGTYRVADYVSYVPSDGLSLFIILITLRSY